MKLYKQLFKLELELNIIKKKTDKLVNYINNRTDNEMFKFFTEEKKEVRNEEIEVLIKLHDDFNFEIQNIEN